jgi:DNA-binding transcriptional MerR regulator/methylmalonyl-CoA mutase cobalamin-binding subunit
MSSAELRIGELSRRVGVSPPVLRAWERRYGLLRPTRTAGGQRLYSAADEDRVRRMLAHMARGFSAGAAARLALLVTVEPAASSPAPRPDGTLPGLVGALLAAVEGFDDAAAGAALDRLLASYAVETVLRDAVLPVLSDLGDRWERGELTVAQEHFASSVIGGRLHGLARGWGRGEGPRALLACAPAERHDLGLLSFGLALREHGWRVSYLGADTPVAALADAAERLRPAIVVVSAVRAAPFSAAVTGLAALAARRPLAIGGAGGTAGLATSMGARHLAGDAVSAAAAVAAEVRGAGERGVEAGAPGGVEAGAPGGELGAEAGGPG